jgi:hypothetical protein
MFRIRRPSPVFLLKLPKARILQRILSKVGVNRTAQKKTRRKVRTGRKPTAEPLLPRHPLRKTRRAVISLMGTDVVRTVRCRDGVSAMMKTTTT